MWQLNYYDEYGKNSIHGFNPQSLIECLEDFNYVKYEIFYIGWDRFLKNYNFPKKIKKFLTYSKNRGRISYNNKTRGYKNERS